MSAKRSYSSDLSNARKRIKQGNAITPTASISLTESELLKFIPNNTNDAINHLFGLFPSNQQLNLPPFIYLHQLYNFSNLNRTQIDKDIIQLKQENKIKVFKFETKSEYACLCYTDSLVNYFKSLLNSNEESNYNEILPIVIDKFYKRPTEVSIRKNELLNECKLKDSVITKLIQNGFLTIKDENEYWHSVPNIVLFIKLIHEARKLITFIISKKKYKEITINELKDRNFKKLRILGILYHCYDLIGSDIVQRVESPMSLTIRLNRDE